MICSSALVSTKQSRASFAQRVGCHLATCKAAFSQARDGERRRTNEKVWHGVIKAHAYRTTMCLRAQERTCLKGEHKTWHTIMQPGTTRRGETIDSTDITTKQDNAGGEDGRPRGIKPRRLNRTGNPHKTKRLFALRVVCLCGQWKADQHIQTTCLMVTRMELKDALKDSEFVQFGRRSRSGDT